MENNDNKISGSDNSVYTIYCTENANKEYSEERIWSKSSTIVAMGKSILELLKVIDFNLDIQTDFRITKTTTVKVITEFPKGKEIGNSIVLKKTTSTEVEEDITNSWQYLLSQFEYTGPMK